MTRKTIQPSLPGGVETAVVAAYAKAEAEGRVSRESNSTALSAEDYARMDLGKAGLNEPQAQAPPRP